MKILAYNEIDYSGIEKQYKKVIEMLGKDDFRSAEVKKIDDSLYRAKIDYSNRLLFKICTFNAEQYALILEVIRNHDYKKSRFLNGSPINEEKLLSVLKASDIKDTLSQIAYLNTKNKNFNILDKILSFDEQQTEIFNLRTPLVIIGSAGSGKTVLTLEKLKHLSGDGLYISISSFLVENSRGLYYSNNYLNDAQNIDFLSFNEYLETIKVSSKKELTSKVFENWFQQNKATFKIKDSHKLYEEFNGVITGSTFDARYLSLEEYQNLGIKRSVFLDHDRSEVYRIFQRYLRFLESSSYYDSNVISYDYIGMVKEKYDFLIVDEVQDFTNCQLNIILKSLKNKFNFILSGDSNQIVHPNFFAWSNVKTLFYNDNSTDSAKLLRVITTNYRNSVEVTELANRLLLIKNSRFGSIDKESNYLITSIKSNNGKIELLNDTIVVKSKLNNSTSKSTKYAVIVMKEEQKAKAAKFFSTPLIFSIQEAKGLEYENIILHNFVSDAASEFLDIVEGVSEEYLGKDLKYSRNRDKSDKSLEAYKFYINSLYVAITRAVKNLYIIENNKTHKLLRLLKIVDFRETTDLKTQESDREEWRHEARKLELQGKNEQADAIRKVILKTEEVPWEILATSMVKELQSQAFEKGIYNNKAKTLIFEYAVSYHSPGLLQKLSEHKFIRATKDLIKEEKEIDKKYHSEYYASNFVILKAKMTKYGVDFRDRLNNTPLMNAVKLGKIEIIDYLLQHDANLILRNTVGMQAQHMALRKAYSDPVYAENTLGDIYKKIEPFSLKVKILDKMIKLDNKQMPFFILNMMFAAQVELMKNKIHYNVPAFQSSDFCNALVSFPEYIMPAYRKRKNYISSILSENEIFRESSSTKMLFLRVRLGYYVINPVLEFEVGDGWVNVYELMQFEDNYNASPVPIHKKMVEFLNNSKERIINYLNAR